MNIPTIFWVVPAASIVALLFAWAFYRLMKREDEGTQRMREIAAHVRKRVCRTAGFRLPS